MKKLVLLAVMSGFAITGVEVAHAPAAAERTAATPASAKSCPEMTRIRSASILNGSSSAPSVTCSSSEWCCRHDIGGTGECVSCCSR
jgi:hypothetical protein